jgi:ectoine hydroxylase-related dioxygenase (phytanoyl-CoA dioxygenase family)
MTTATTLPPITGDYTLTPDQPAAFARDGHITLRGVASPEEIAAWRPVFAKAVKDLSTEQRPLEKRDTYGKAFLQVGDLWNRAPATQPFVLARRFAKIAAELMGVRGVRMYHDQALYKEPHGGSTPWHQDQFYWPLATEKSITMWMPMVDIDAYQGSITFASGSQVEGYLSKEISISDESEQFYQTKIKTKGYKVSNAGKMAAGDATFHAGWTVHGAPANRSDKAREVMTIIYIDSEMRVAEADNPSRVADLRVWFPGLKPGDLANSPMNPVLYQA